METTTVASVPVEKIQPNPWNRKSFDPDAMQDLIHSIKAGGIQEPLIVRSKNGGYEIASGNRRWLAAKEAGLKEVPCIVQTLTDQQVAEDNIIMNIQREDIAPLELAQMLADYGKKNGKSQREMAGIFGKTEGWVSQYLGFLTLPEDLKNFTAVKFSMTDLRAIKQLSAEKQEILAQELKNGTLKPEDVQKRAKQMSSASGDQKPKAPAEHTDGNTPPVQEPEFSAGGQKFTFTKRGHHFTMVTDADHLDSLDVFMQNIRCAFIDYMSASAKKSASAAS